MNSPDEQPVTAGKATQRAEDDATGLPWPRTWPAVYVLVMGSFVLWVVLLYALTAMFS